MENTNNMPYKLKDTEGNIFVFKGYVNGYTEKVLVYRTNGVSKYFFESEIQDYEVIEQKAKNCFEFKVDFKNIITEFKRKELKLCFLKDRGLFIEDMKGNLYQMETYRYSSYLEELIKDGIIVNFHLVDSTNINDWEKEIWGISEIKSFIKRQSKIDNL